MKLKTENVVMEKTNLNTKYRIPGLGWRWVWSENNVTPEEFEPGRGGGVL